MKHIFIINPVAGNGRYQLELEKQIKSSCQSNNIDYEIYITRSKGDGKSYVEERCKENVPYVFYACGGDGTVHEIINAVYKYPHAAVGIIPCGSGNDFVRNFTSSDNFLNIDKQVNGRIEDIDLIKVKDQYVTSVCNIGFDADTAFNMHKFKKIPFISGSACYAISLIYSLFSRLGKNLEVNFDDNTVVKDNLLLAVVANGQTYGGGYRCAPYARINDGLLDVCLVQKMSRIKILKLVGSYKKGKHMVTDGIKELIRYKKCKKLVIKSDVQINICMDGESYIYNEIDFEAVNKAIRFNIPEGCDFCEVEEEGSALYEAN